MRRSTRPRLLGLVLIAACLVAADGSVTAPADGPAKLVKDLYPGACGGESFDNLVRVKDSVLFFRRGADYSELWKTDGTAHGTMLIKEVSGGYPVAVVDDLLFFVEYGGVWRSDGTTEGTVLLVRRGSFKPLTNLGKVLLFELDRALWRSDGTTEGTVPLTEQFPDTWPGRPSFNPLATLGGVFLFELDRVLWRSDGTKEGTVPLTERFPDPGGRRLLFPLATLGGVLLYEVTGVLWRSDGTSEGTFELTEFSETSFVKEVDGRAFFFRGSELWKSDGTPEGTARVATVVPGEPATEFRDPVEFDGKLFFFSRSGRALWSSDGTAAGTTVVKQLPDSTYPWSPFLPTEVSGGFFFVLHEYGKPSRSQWLWWSDGTPEGTIPVLEGLHGRIPNGWAETNGVSLFWLWQELWRSDGTPEGTVMIRQFTSLGGATPFKGRVFFGADDGVHGFELWSSDGTPSGTLMVKDLNPGPGGSGPSEMVELAGRLLLTAHDGRADALWRTDGTAAGTAILEGAGLNPCNAEGLSGPTADANGTLYFIAGDQEMWRSDGTSEGTVRVGGARSP
jgi:ELWxxDGT repeat protein